MPNPHKCWSKKEIAYYCIKPLRSRDISFVAPCAKYLNQLVLCTCVSLPFFNRNAPHLVYVTESSSFTTYVKCQVVHSGPMFLHTWYVSGMHLCLRIQQRQSRPCPDFTELISQQGGKKICNYDPALQEK